MTEPEDGKLADHVVPRVDDARLARQWGVVSGRLAEPARRPPVWAVAAVTTLVTAGVVLAATRPWRAAPAASPVTVSVGSQTITLPDGSRVTIERDANVSVEEAVADRVRLALRSGAIELEVTHREGRSFVVTAGGHDVTVVGTRFRVEAGAASLAVEVHEGVVRVLGPSGPHVLSAGQRWTTVTSVAPPPPELSAPSAPSAPSAAASTEPSGAPPSPSPAGEAPGSEGARELLTRATDARAAGRYREAAAALDTLRRRHRSDPRAGLAAFELGRIRLDTLGDPAGASEAFADAIALSPRATFREDAEARRVEALDAAHNTAACEQARDAYLGRYPSGIHVRQVSQQCRVR